MRTVFLVTDSTVYPRKYSLKIFTTKGHDSLLVLLKMNSGSLNIIFIHGDGGGGGCGGGGGDGGGGGGCAGGGDCGGGSGFRCW